jgi:hypothetical protein
MMRPLRTLFRPTSAIAGLLLVGLPLLARPVAAQDENQDMPSSCVDSRVISVPSRPTVSNGAETTQCGVLETEYGLEREWPTDAKYRDDLSGGLRFGLTPEVDLHWASADFARLGDAGGSRTGFADTWLGVKYHFLDHSKMLPDFGLFYQVKIPAGDGLGLSSGKVDHSFSFLVSRDVKPVHLDFNIIGLLAGRPVGGGFDHDTGFALSGSVPLVHTLSLVAEGYGSTFLNLENPAFASTMLGFTYQINPRLIIDTGIDVGVTHDAPHKRVYVGVTYAIANVYRWVRQH